MGLYEFEVGKRFPLLAYRPEGAMLEIDSSGILLVYAFDHPTEKEKQSVKESMPFSIREIKLGRVLYLLTKFGSIPWQECPYDPHISKTVSKLDKPAPGKGYPLMFVFADHATQKPIKNLLTMTFADGRSGEQVMIMYVK